MSQTNEDIARLLYHISEDISSIRKKFSEFVETAKLNASRNENTVELPKDCNGQIWTGKESRFVEQYSPMENRRFLDGLLWTGDKWFLFQNSLDGTSFSLTPCEDAKHYDASMDSTESSEIWEFISRRFSKDCDWVSGNCLWFAKIIKARFPDTKIMYAPITGHFCIKSWDNKFIDHTGVWDTMHEELVEFDEIEKEDPNLYEMLIRDCFK